MHGGNSSHCNGKGLMSYGEGRPNTWSYCSNEDFKEWFKTWGFSCFAKDAEEVSCGPDMAVKVECADKSV